MNEVPSGFTLQAAYRILRSGRVLLCCQESEPRIVEEVPFRMRNMLRVEVLRLETGHPLGM